MTQPIHPIAPIQYQYLPAMAGIGKDVSSIFAVSLAFFILGLFGYQGALTELLMTPRFSMALALAIGVVMVYKLLENSLIGLVMKNGISYQYRSFWMPLRVALLGVLILPMGGENTSLLSFVFSQALRLGAAAGR